MNEVTQFEEHLLAIDPSQDQSLLEIDRLVESIPADLQIQLIPSIFRFFEKFPLESCGAPGTLVHLTEHFYPSYTKLLLESLERIPSYNAVLMLNRILNSRLDSDERQRYLTVLSEIANSPSTHPKIAKQAQHFIEFQARKNNP